MCEIRINELEHSVTNLKNYIMAEDIMMNMQNILFWVKDKKLRHLKLNKATLDNLYNGASQTDVIGLTDYEYFKKIGCEDKILKNIKKCCSLSDQYLLQSKNVSETFFERIFLKDGSSFWISVAKEKVPPSTNPKEIWGICGTAIKFPTAQIIIENRLQELDKISENVYRII